MTEIPNGVTPPELQPKPEVPIKDKWVKGFLRGTKRWPQLNEGINIFTSVAIVNDPPTDWVALSQSRLSAEQISKVDKATSDPPKSRYAPLATVEHAQDKNPILSEDSLSKIWDDVVQDNVMDTIVGYIDLIKPPAKRHLRSPQEKAEAIQAFFDDPENRESIGTLTDVLEAASNALVTPDSLDLSNFYKASLTGDAASQNLRDKYKTRYQGTFANGLSFNDEPARCTWNLAAYNVSNALKAKLPGQDISWLELETGDEMTPWFRKINALPEGVRKADAAPPESVAGINPDSLLILDDYSENKALLSVLEGYDGLRADFLRYLIEQDERRTFEGFPLMATPQESFDQDVGWFCTVTDSITRAVEKHPGRKVNIFLDCDEFMGKTDEKSDPIQADGLEKIEIRDLDKKQHDDLQAIHINDAVKRFVFRPAFKHAIKWAQKEYPDQVRLYTLSTKPQAFLDALAPKLEELCPGAFEGRIFSSRDGAAERIIPEIIQKGKTERSGKQAMDITVKQALDAFLAASPAERTFVPERIINASKGDGKLTEYDQKLFIIIRELERRRNEGIEALMQGPPEGLEEDEWNQSLSLEEAALLLEDGLQTSASPETDLIEHVLLPRFMFPDDLDDITV